jgi:cytochrome c oxidase subunit 3/cytochrome o ubiquinol oxidase subunit 3
MTFMVYRGKAAGGPRPQDVWDIPYTSVSAAVLLLSSLAIVLALTYLQRGNERAFRIWLVATAALGLLFLGGQFYEFTTFYREGLTLHSSLFGTTFFVLTGFHGTHVGIGVIWLLSLAWLSKRGKIPPARSEMAEIVALYWHFVDIVWIIIFAVVYLIPYKP